MSYTRPEFVQKVSEIIKDDADKLASDEKDRFIQEAVKIYSKHRPRKIVKEITGDGTYDYSFATHLTSWAEEFSVIKSIEYPADYREPEILDQDDWIIHEKASGKVIRFLEATPSATETIRVVYTGLHILSDTQNTIPEVDEDAVSNLAASLCSAALASAYATATDSTITADSVDHKSKSEKYETRARAQKKIYIDHLAIKEGQVLPATATGDMDLSPAHGAGRLTHTKK